MSSEWELDEGIKSIKSAWRREHTARANLEKMLEQAEAENAKLQELANGYEALTATLCNERGCDRCPLDDPEQIVCEHMRLQTCLAELEIEKEKKDGMEA